MREGDVARQCVQLHPTHSRSGGGGDGGPTHSRSGGDTALTKPASVTDKEAATAVGERIAAYVCVQWNARICSVVCMCGVCGMWCSCVCIHAGIMDTWAHVHV